MVEGIGNFKFAKRTMHDEIKVQVEYARMIDGVVATDWLALVCGWIAALTVLTVSAPDGWDMEDIDPLDDDSYAKLAKVHSALVAKELSFRSRPKASGEGSGAPTVKDPGVLVSPQVRADGD